MRQIVFTLPLLFLLLGRTAHAYLLPADFLCRLLGETRRLAPVAQTYVLEESLNANPNLVLNDTKPEAGVPAQDANHDGAASTLLETIPLRLFVKKPERMRFVRESGSDPVTLLREGRVWVGDNEKLVQKMGTKPLLASLLYPKGKALDDIADGIFASLSAQGIDVKVTSLTRLGDRFAYVIGAEPWETQKPIILIDKEKYWLVGIRLPEIRGDRTVWVETRLTGWGEGPSAFAPTLIETFEDTHLVLRQKWVSLQATGPLPETLFDPSGPRRRL